MSWNEELENVKLATLFRLFGKTLVAGILWYLILIAVVMVPIIIIMAAFGMAYY